MEKEFVDYKIGLELKELGFDEPCLVLIDPPICSSDKFRFAHVNKKGKMTFQRNSFWGHGSVYPVAAPTYQQAFRWFREKYKMFSHLDQNAYGKYYYDIHNRGEIFFDEDYFESHEEAELACLKKLIEIVKQK